MPVKELAGRVGAGESTVARRVDSMVARGCLRFRTLVEPGLLGFAVEFMLWLDVEPAHLEAAGRQLARDPGVKYLSATAGRFNLCGQVSLRHFADLYRFTTDVVGALPGVRRADTTLQLERAQARLGAHRAAATGRDRREERPMNDTTEPWQVGRGDLARPRRARARRPPPRPALAGWRDGRGGAVVRLGPRDDPAARRARPSPGKLSQGEYGSRVGAPRILRRPRGSPASPRRSSCQPCPRCCTRTRRATTWPPVTRSRARLDPRAEHAARRPRDERDLAFRALDVLERGHRRAPGRHPHAVVGLLRRARWTSSARRGPALRLVADGRRRRYELLADGEPTGIVEIPVEWIRDDAPYLTMDRHTGTAALHAAPRPAADLDRRVRRGARRRRTLPADACTPT